MQNAAGVSVNVSAEYKQLLNPSAQQFLATLHRCFNQTRINLLNERVKKQEKIQNGWLPTFNPDTKYIRDDPTWTAAKPAPGLADRRVEITGPVSRKMVINALNSGASTFMADFEDSTAPTWENILEGQVNLIDANKKTISFHDKKSGKSYSLNEKIATLLVRPRGWHMVEKHFLVDGEPISASLFDFGLYFFHNVHQTLKNGLGPYFYLPKMESHLEARLWNDVFNVAQDMLNIPRGTIRGTVLIETILASFEMDEIIYELRDHSSGLNCGRWDYIFSFIKKFKHDPKFVLPQRADITMTTPFMDAYVKLLIKTCHKRGVHAMGGMAAQIPIKNNPEANSKAMEKVRKDKLREVTAGHDGTWVAHPDLVKIELEIFNKHMPQPNQLYKQYPEIEVKASDLLNYRVVGGKITYDGLVANVQVSLLYLQAWLLGNGCVPIHNLMEHGSKTDDGKVVTRDLVNKIIDEQVKELEKSAKPGVYDKPAGFLKRMVVDYPEFITL
ncbi:hypothetical protein HDU92_006705 [Lobulomyces angularis]|nr:hypothetical protein HDU92_006705 [Lobulomyces angularis]